MDMKPKVTRQLALAIKRMREACDDAERTIQDGDGPACSRVMHAFAWGLANASSHIETAFGHVEDAHELARLEPTTGAPDDHTT